MRDEGVNEGLSDYKPGINVKDGLALVSRYTSVDRTFHAMRMIFTPDSVISDNFDAIVPGDANGMGTLSDATVAVTGSLILIYTLWAGLTLQRVLKESGR